MRHFFLGTGFQHSKEQFGSLRIKKEDKSNINVRKMKRQCFQTSDTWKLLLNISPGLGKNSVRFSGDWKCIGACRWTQILKRCEAMIDPKPYSVSNTRSARKKGLQAKLL